MLVSPTRSVASTEVFIGRGARLPRASRGPLRVRGPRPLEGDTIAPMTQSPGQFEIQLGHLCNNRCVFCVSGQLTSKGEAPLLRGDDLCQALDQAWAAGYRRVTLLGGEPTIQPYFMDVVRRAVALGFD